MTNKNKNISENVPILRDDRVFKRVLKRRLNILEFLINSVTHNNFKADDLFFLDTEFPNEKLYSKNSRLDLYVLDQSGARVNIEVQNIVSDEFDVRRHHFVALSLIDQIKRAKTYSLAPLISIYIVNDTKNRYPFSLINFEKYDTIGLQNKENLTILKDKPFISEFIINLANLENDNRIDGRLKNLLSLFTAKTVEELEKMVKDNNDFNDVYKEVREITQEEIFGLQSILKQQAELDEKTRISKIKREAVESGLKQGIEQGIEQGIAIATEKNIINLLDSLDDKTLSSKFGVELSYVENLRKKHE